MFNIVVLVSLGVLCVIPFIHMVAISFSDKGPAGANLVGLWPIGFNLEAYKHALSDDRIIKALGMSFLRVAVGVTINMVLTLITAYPLSKEPNKFPGRTWYVWLCVVTMLFHGGLIPTYILVNDLGLVNSVWALVLPGALPVFNVIILLNFFRQIPKEIEESAFMDGASYFTSLVKIYIPLSVPALATLVLLSSIGHWNAWFDGLIYMTDASLYPIQTYMQVLQTQLQSVESLADAQRMIRVSQKSLMMAYNVITLIPILCLYPFLQKYVKDGLVMGSVKG
ncbi:carbohydrate ABC transporter permease [Paenibacillus sp. S3N08]|uniref:Carbohydrate ABC transporter permease n=2 Tax=Paenibacillus agricola TaxID=2716264 RepID=A0ABX0JB68_9BACL|nr:carbohydrate ABC transporter permease [Paenibacillus agricola]